MDLRRPKPVQKCFEVGRLAPSNSLAGVHQRETYSYARRCVQAVTATAAVITAALEGNIWNGHQQKRLSLSRGTHRAPTPGRHRSASWEALVGK